MSHLLILALLSWAPQNAGAGDAALRSFSFCRENPGGDYAVHCFELNGEGKGTFKFTPRDDDTVEVPFELSPDAADRFRELLRETDYLREGASYESGRRVANLGTKTMIAEGSWGTREAVFNYSTKDEVAELSGFLEQLITQEMLLFELDIALQFDRLGVPERLEAVEREVQADRIPDRDRVVGMLERIESDSRLVNYARTTATRLKEELLDD